MKDDLSLTEFPVFFEHYYPADYLTSIALFCFFLEKNYDLEFEERFDAEPQLPESPQIVSELLSKQDALTLLSKIESSIVAAKCRIVPSRYAPNSHRVLIDYDLIAYHTNLKTIREYINSRPSLNEPRYCIRQGTSSQDKAKIPSFRVLLLKRLEQNGFLSLSPEEYDDLLGNINELNFYILTETELLAELSDALKKRRTTWQHIIQEWPFTIPVLLQLARKQNDLQETLQKELNNGTFVQLVAQCDSESVFIQFIRQAFHSIECRDHILIDLTVNPYRYIDMVQHQPRTLFELIELALANEEIAKLLQSSVIPTEEQPDPNLPQDEESFKLVLYHLLTTSLFNAAFGENNTNEWLVLIRNARFNPVARKFLEHALCHPVQLADTKYYDSPYYQNGLLALLTEPGYHNTLPTLFELAKQHHELRTAMAKALRVTNTTKNVLHELSVHTPDYLSGFLALSQSSPVLQDALANILDKEKSCYSIIPAVEEKHEEENEVQSDDSKSWGSYYSRASHNTYGAVMDLAKGRVYHLTRSNGEYETLPSLSLLAKAEPDQLFKIIKMTDTSLKMREVFSEIIPSPAWKEITSHLSEQDKLALYQLAVQSSQAGYSSSFFNNTGINPIWHLIAETMKENNILEESAPSSSLS
ncbi:MAG: hypothetical protein P4L79_11400 [Legionella sp.]|uniref:hypothetical protein n=1 Tax=Legionella sp. TaxID=459 RepID=UPI0028467921|nr:hypothetical protein [Legionella sp.]